MTEPTNPLGTPTPGAPVEDDKAKDETAQGNVAASGTGPTQAEVIDSGAVISDTSDDDANPKNDPSDDKVRRELEANAAKGNDPSHVTSSDESPVVRDNGVDLFAASDTGPNRQGNAYGLSRDAVENFKRDLNDEKDRLNQRLKDLDRQLDELDIPDDNTNANIAAEQKAEAEGKSRDEVQS